jgi:hypothetical protein
MLGHVRLRSLLLVAVAVGAFVVSGVAVAGASSARSTHSMTALGGVGSVSSALLDYEPGWVAGSNPNGLWRYGWSSGLQGGLNLFTRASVCPVNNKAEHMWDDPANSVGCTPSIARNSGGDFDDGNVHFAAGALILHPGGTDGHAYAHAIWTAPADGAYTIGATFYAQQYGVNVDVHVLVNGANKFAAAITNGETRAFSHRYKLLAGQTIDFAVGPNGNFNLHPGNTGLEAVVLHG